MVKEKRLRWKGGSGKSDSKWLCPYCGGEFVHHGKGYPACRRAECIKARASAAARNARIAAKARAFATVSLPPAHYTHCRCGKAIAIADDLCDECRQVMP